MTTFLIWKLKLKRRMILHSNSHYISNYWTNWPIRRNFFNTNSFWLSLFYMKSYKDLARVVPLRVNSHKYTWQCYQELVRIVSLRVSMFILWVLHFCHSCSRLFSLIQLKTLPRISVSCPIKSECVHNVILKFLSHKFLLILTGIHENITDNYRHLDH